MVLGELVEQDSGLSVPSEVEEKACQGGAVERVPGIVVDRGADRGFLLGRPTLFATEQKPMTPGGRQIRRDPNDDPILGIQLVDDSYDPPPSA